jgi:hypothetical protein
MAMLPPLAAAATAATTGEHTTARPHMSASILAASPRLTSQKLVLVHTAVVLLLVLELLLLLLLVLLVLLMLLRLSLDAIRL